jgi:sec-independent protein translocase protein TatC
MRKALRTIANILAAPFRFIFWLARTIFLRFRNFFREMRNFLSQDPEDIPLGDSLQKVIENPASILTHLADLRKHLFRAVAVLIVTVGISLYYASAILDWLARPIGGIDELQAIDVTEPIGSVMRVALLSGFSIALPYVSMELLLFAAPGLKRRARLQGFISIPLIVLFFFAGMAFAYFFMLPSALPFLLNFMGIPTLVRPSSYIRFTTGLMFWIGLAFEFPLIAYILSSMGVLRAELLREQWRVAFILLAVMAAAITPTIDPINMMIVLIPLWALYGISIVLAYIAQGRRARRIEL